MPATLASSQPVPGGALSAPVLVDRRRSGELFPSIPVGAVELSREEAASVFLRNMHWLPGLASDGGLIALLADKVAQHGRKGIAEHVPHFRARYAAGDVDAGSAWAYARRLSILFWYKGAYTRRMTITEAAVALYFSSLPVQPLKQVDGMDLTGLVHEGIARVGADSIVWFGEDVRHQMCSLRHVPGDELSPEYLAFMPNARRRRFAYQAAHRNILRLGPRLPLVAQRPGGHAFGTTLPTDPYDPAR